MLWYNTCCICWNVMYLICSIRLQCAASVFLLFCLWTWWGQSWAGTCPVSPTFLVGSMPYPDLSQRRNGNLNYDSHITECLTPVQLSWYRPILCQFHFCFLWIHVQTWSNWFECKYFEGFLHKVIIIRLNDSYRLY